MEGLRNDKRKADIMENQVDIGLAMTSESSATTARELGISLMNALRFCGRSKSLRIRIMKKITIPSSLVAMAAPLRIGIEDSNEVFQRVKVP